MSYMMGEKMTTTTTMTMTDDLFKPGIPVQKKIVCVCVFQARKKKNIVVLRKEGERRRGEKNSSCKYIDAFGS